MFKRNAEINKDVRIPKKIIVDFRISVNFYKNISSVKIMEFNKNRTCVQTIIYTDFSEIPYMYMTADETRYVKCITYEKNDNISHEYSIAARGDELKMLLETYYGFIYEKKIKFY